MVGKGSLNHNSREFYASNVDPNRSHLNIEFCCEDIRNVYHELFDEAQERFNAKQTRNDRRIEDYYEKICSSKQEKPFHEIVLQIGNKDDTTIAEKQTRIDEIEQTLQSVQQQVVDLDKIENVSVKKTLLSDKVTLPRSDFENLLSAAKQYVVYRRQDDRLQGLLDAANDKIKQLEGVIGELKQKVSKLVSKLSNIEFWHSQELNEVKSESREVHRENLMLKHEQKGLMNLLQRYGIDPAKERIREHERDER